MDKRGKEGGMERKTRSGKKYSTERERKREREIKKGIKRDREKIWTHILCVLLYGKKRSGKRIVMGIIYKEGEEEG